MEERATGKLKTDRQLALACVAQIRKGNLTFTEVHREVKIVDLYGKHLVGFVLPEDLGRVLYCAKDSVVVVTD